MGIELTEKQKAALQSIRGGAGHIAIKHAGALRALGLVEKAVVEGFKPGFVGAAITAAGLSLLGL